MRKFLVFMAIAALAALSAAGMASAGSNLSNGTIVTGTGTNVALGGVATCGHSVVKGAITNTAVGVHQSITSASFSNCNNGVVVHTSVATPWTLTTTSQSGTQFFGSVSNVDVTLTNVPLVGTCRYTGTLSGGWYDNATEKLTVAGSLNRASGICPSTASASGTYHISPTLQLS